MHNVTPPILHCDLKSSNVMIASKDENAQIIAKVTDFGASSFVFRDLKAPNVLESAWQAPEILRDEPFNTPSDVYSFAVTLWEILYRDSPNTGFRHLPFLKRKETILNGARPLLSSPSDETEKQLHELICKCWDGSPKKRPTFKHIQSELATILLETFDDLTYTDTRSETSSSLIPGPAEKLKSIQVFKLQGRVMDMCLENEDSVLIADSEGGILRYSATVC